MKRILALVTAIALTVGIGASTQAQALTPEHVNCYVSAVTHVRCSHGHWGLYFRAVGRAQGSSNVYTVYGDWENSGCSRCSSGIYTPNGVTFLGITGVQTR
jgi:hypothetical protein